MSYALVDYSWMLAHGARVDAYLAALARHVRPGSVVLDIGAGSGFFTLEACRLGARRVYAVDPSPSLHALRAVIEANGLGERVVCLNEASTAISLPERADVVISDLRGSLPLFGGHLASLADARARHLAEGGVLLPWRDSLRVAVVEAAEPHRRMLAPWGGRATPYDATPIVRMLENNWRSERPAIPPEARLTPSEEWAVVDYHAVTAPDVRGEARCGVERAGVAHGLVVSFDAEVAEGLGFSSWAPDSVYGTPFFPWPRPVELDEGDVVEVRLRADLLGGAYTWRWSTRVGAKARFDQSTFLGEPLAAEDVRRVAPGHVPAVTVALEIDRFVLERFGSGETLDAIARALEERFPARFGPHRPALAHVAALSARYRT